MTMSVSVVTTETLSQRGNETREVSEVISIKNSGGALGIKIIGGKSSTGAEFGIFVKKILAGGVAELDGRLYEGDQILEANGESMLGVTNDRALSILRTASQSQNVKLLVNRDSQARMEFSKLMSLMNGGSAFPITGLSNGTSLLTRNGSFGSSRGSTPSPTMGKRSWVLSGGGRMSPLALGRHGSPTLSPSSSVDQPSAGMRRMYSLDLPTLPVGSTTTVQQPGADSQGSQGYKSGSQMLGIRSSRNMAEQAQYTNGDINGNINGEVPSFYTRHSRPDPDYSPLGTATMNGADGHSPDDTANLMAERHSISSEVTADSGLPTDRHSTSSSPTFDQRPGELQTVTITQHRGLGLCIIGGTNRVEGPLIYIDDLIEGADAHKDGRLRRGDQLVKVNGETLVGVTHEQAKSLLTRLKLRQDIRTIEVTFIRGGQRSSSQAERNGSPLAASALPNSGPVYAGNEVDPRLPSAAAQPDLSDSEIFMQQLLAAPGDTSIASAANFVNPQSQGSPTAMNFVSPDGSPRHQASPPVIVPSLLPAEAVSQVQNLEAAPPLVGYASSQPIGTGYPDHVATALPQGMLGGFQPASYSTPLVPGGAYPAQPGTVHMNGAAPVIPGNQFHPPHSSPASLEVSPVGPPPQTFEPSSVPYYLQQDLEALRRISHQSATSPNPQSTHNGSSGQQSLVPAAHASSLRPGSRLQRNARNNRRLSLDPHTKLKVEKLEVALRYLGFEPTDAQQRELRSKLHVDPTGCVSYGDFVHMAREVFAVQLAERPLHNSAFQFAIRDANAATDRSSFLQMQQQSQQIASLEAVAKQSAEDVEKIRRERDEALREVAHLRRRLKQQQEECVAAEDEVARSRRDAQGLLERSRSLESRVHLASQAQEAARSMEQDYEEVIRLLEKELETYKAKAAQIKPDPKEFEELKKRLTVLGCQLRKAEVGRRTYEVATEKLIHFAETVYEVMVDGGTATPDKKGKGESVRRDGGARPPNYLAHHAKQTPGNLAKEARDTVKSIKALLEEEPLPFGWEEAYTADGVRYYINHVTQETSWLHPVSRVQHLPAITENGHRSPTSEAEIR